MKKKYIILFFVVAIILVAIPITWQIIKNRQNQPEKKIEAILKRDDEKINSKIKRAIEETDFNPNIATPQEVVDKIDILEGIFNE